MELFVEEIGTTSKSTASQMFVDGKPFCFIVEDGYNEVKVMGKTRIPPGRYQVVKRTFGKFYQKYKKDFEHGYALELKDVPGFKDILIHIGNTIEDTRGCLLTNKGISLDGSLDYFGTSSTVAYLALYKAIDKAFKSGLEVWIEISRRDVVTEGGAVG